MSENNINRDIGRIEGQLQGIVATLARVDERSAARDEAFEEIRNQLNAMASNIATLQKQAADQVLVTAEFNALQRTIRDGQMQVKGFGKGLTAGIWAAAAGGGALAATGVQKIYAFFTG